MYIYSPLTHHTQTVLIKRAYTQHTKDYKNTFDKDTSLDYFDYYSWVSSFCMQPSDHGQMEDLDCLSLGMKNWVVQIQKKCRKALRCILLMHCRLHYSWERIYKDICRSFLTGSSHRYAGIPYSTLGEKRRWWSEIVLVEFGILLFKLNENDMTILKERIVVLSTLGRKRIRWDSGFS